MHGLGMPYYVFNFTEDFDRQVIDRFVRTYEEGGTPNPCIDCNRYMKHEKLYHRAETLGCDVIVTGHYARIEQDPATGRWLLKKAKNLAKDQSYVLYFLTQQQLAHTMFPLGNFASKEEVREVAEKYGFKFPKSMKLPERLKTVQAAMEKGDEKAVKVYLEIGRFLAHAIPWYNEFYDYENMMILGRVTSGLGGSMILGAAKAMRKDVYPEWAEKIDIFMPDEKARRLGQSVAAAQIPVIKKR